jgi:hypothetical protein
MRQHIVIAILILLMGCATAQAELLFELTSPALAGVPGDTLHFQATVTNTGVEDIFLNGDTMDLIGDWSELTVDDRFFTNVPVSLAGGVSWTDYLFDVTIGSTAQAGDYFGSFDLQGGVDESAGDTLASQNFQVTVQVIPEPAGMTVLLSGLTALAGLGRRRRK